MNAPAVPAQASAPSTPYVPAVLLYELKKCGGSMRVTPEIDEAARLLAHDGIVAVNAYRDGSVWAVLA